MSDDTENDENPENETEIEPEPTVVQPLDQHVEDNEPRRSSRTHEKPYWHHDYIVSNLV